MMSEQTKQAMDAAKEIYESQFLGGATDFKRQVAEVIDRAFAERLAAADEMESVLGDIVATSRRSHERKMAALTRYAASKEVPK